jgi:hypothetical protein
VDLELIFLSGCPNNGVRRRLSYLILKFLHFMSKKFRQSSSVK